MVQNTCEIEGLVEKQKNNEKQLRVSQEIKKSA
jgi:hypothetical protein